MLSRDGGHRVTSLRVPGLLFAGVAPADGHDEIIAVAEHVTPEQKQWTVSTARLDAGHLVRTGEELLYQLSSSSAGWIGARLAELDLVIDLDVRADAFVASGVLLNRPQNSIHDAVPLAPAIVARKHRAGPSVGSLDGGLQPAERDAASTASDAATPDDAGLHHLGHGGDAHEIPDARSVGGTPIKPAK